MKNKVILVLGVLNFIIFILGVSSVDVDGFCLILGMNLILAILAPPLYLLFGILNSRGEEV
jgi:hypothetical protein